MTVLVPSTRDSEVIRDWTKKKLPQLNFPEVYVPEMNSIQRDWNDPKWKDSVKVCMCGLVEYGGFIANLGVSILYDNMNNRMDNVVCERFYTPEKKMKKWMAKDRIPYFSKETFKPLTAFDIVALSSFYPLQFFGVPETFERSGMPYLASERGEEFPLVVMGGVAAFNPAPVHKFLDCFFLGDGEGQLEEAIEIYREMKANHATKREILERWAREVRGCYVPSLYEETYYPADHESKPNQVIAHTPIVDWAPKKVKKSVADLEKIKPLTNMFVSNSEGQEMSAGSLEITRGCGDKCLFCEGSYRSQPYRERPLDMIKESFTDLIRNTGAKSVTPYGFNLSDHSQVNSVVYFLMEDAERKVSMSSQRIDKFSEEFAKVAYESGNKSLTIAIESASERMRSKVSKNVDEETILKTFRTIFEVGFLKVKVYMIANLPGETQEDIDYLIPLAKKIRAIQAEVQGDRMKTQIRFSWTPFNAKAHTPLQWAQTYKLDENGMPVMAKTMTAVIEGMREIGYGVRIGTDSELSVVNQCISLGDRRMADVIEQTYLSPDFNYEGGMSIGLRKPLVDFLKVLQDNGLSYEFMLRERDREEVFAWDFINMGVTKKFLINAYFESFMKAEDISQCYLECAKCGGCTPSSVKYFKKAWKGELEPDRHDILELVAKRFKKRVVQRLRFKINIKREFRYVHASKIKNYVRRCMIRAGVPSKGNVILTSDKFKFNNWSFGIEYGEVALYTAFPITADLVNKLNATFDEFVPFTFEAVESFSDDAAPMYQSFEFTHYKMFIPLEDKPSNVIEGAIEKCNTAEEFLIKVKVPGEQRDTTQTITLDAKKYIDKIWSVRVPGGTEVHSTLRDLIGPYELFPFVFGTSKRNFLRVEVERVDHLIPKEEGAQDMFADLCLECGKEIELNCFGGSISETHCVRHLHLAEGYVPAKA